MIGFIVMVVGLLFVASLLMWGVERDVKGATTNSSAQPAEAEPQPSIPSHIARV